jgi:hypothetical protein
MGASRWLDANTLAGASMSSAMTRATIDFKCFMVFASEIELKTGPQQGRGWSASNTAPHPAQTNDCSVYNP